MLLMIDRFEQWLAILQTNPNRPDIGTSIDDLLQILLQLRLAQVLRQLREIDRQRLTQLTSVANDVRTTVRKHVERGTQQCRAHDDPDKPNRNSKCDKKLLHCVYVMVGEVA